MLFTFLGNSPPPTSSPHSSPGSSPSFDRVELGTRGARWRPMMAPLLAFVQLQIESECARILHECGLVFQFSGLLTSGSFIYDEKKVLYFEQKGSSLCTNPGLRSFTAWRILIKVQVRCNALIKLTRKF